MLLHRKARLAFTLLGLGTLFLLSAAQVGLLIGWVNTITAVMAHTDVDIWVMAENAVSWEYGSSIPRHRIYQARNVKGVAWTEGLYVGWSLWQRPDGERLNVQVIGLDQNSVGGPWSMRDGTVECVHQADSVIVDELFLDMLGVKRLGEEFELRYHKKAIVRGISRGVRTFTASPYIFTSMKTVPKYDASFHHGETTYVLVKCLPGEDPKQVARAIKAEVPDIDALTTYEFMKRSVLFWLVKTGMGLLVIVTATLGVVVSAVVGAQTLYNITQDHLGHYATLLAVGFSRRQIVRCVLLQGLALGGGGMILGSAGFHAASVLSSRTPAPLEMTPAVFAGLVASSVAFSLLGSFLSVKPILRIDPSVVFRV
jgi:putative ABC transport system permease protein